MKLNDLLSLRWLKKQAKSEKRVEIKTRHLKRFSMPNDGFFSRNYYTAVKNADRENRAKFPSRRARMKAKKRLTSPGIIVYDLLVDKSSNEQRIK